LSYLGDWLESHEDELIDRVLTYAKRQGYAQYSSTLRETWRLSITEITRAIGAAGSREMPDLELTPNETFIDDPLAAFGKLEAQKHRKRGIPFTMFMGLLKYYRQSYIDLIRNHGPVAGYEETAEIVINRLFDRFELAFTMEWTDLSASKRESDLEKENRLQTNTKNKYLTVIESLSTPVVLFSPEGRVKYANQAALHIWHANEHMHQTLQGENGYAALHLPDNIQKTVQSVITNPQLKLETELVDIFIQGQSKHYQIKIAPMRDISNKFNGIVLTAHDISQLHQTRVALSESEWRYRSLFENNHTVMLIINPENGKIEEGNPAAIQFYGFSRSELLDKKISDINTLPQTELNKSLHQASSGHPAPLSFSHQLKSGEIRQVEVFSGPIQRDGRSLLYSIIHDVTDRRRAEAALADSEEKFRSLMTQSPMAIMIYDRAGTLTEVNQAWETLWNVSRENAKFNLYNIFKDDQAAAIGYQAGFEKALNGETAFIPQSEFSPQQSGFEGRTRYISGRFYPLRDSKGEIHNIVILANDITDRVAAQKALEESEARYRLLAENISDVIWTLDTEGRFLYMSPSVKKLRGYTPAEVLNQSMEEALTPESLATVQKAMAHFQTELQAGEHPETHLRFELEQPCKNGGTVWTEVDVVPMFDSLGKIEFFIGVSRDISARQKNRQALKEAKEQAETANQAKGAFLANISHEIRTPLNAILGFTEILENRLESAEERGFVNNIRSAGRSLLSLINDILDLSRIESEHLTLNPSPCDLHEMLLSLQDIFSWQLIEKPIKFALSHDSQIPQGLILDENRLRQMLINLIGNAIKFTEEGQITVKTEQTGMDDSTIDLAISVIDTGIGIKKSQQQEIFEAFRQATGQDAAKYGGTGLGLAITRKLARRMGGEIALESRWNEGATFTIHLPKIKMIHRGNATQTNEDSPLPALSRSIDKKIAIQNISTNQALLKTIDELHLPRWRKLNRSMIINDVISFAKAIESLGTQYRESALLEWSQQLYEQAHSFDMVQLPKTMHHFSNIVKQLGGDTQDAVVATGRKPLHEAE